MHLIIVDKANCNLYTCPALGNTVIKVYDEDNITSGSPRVLKSIDPATQNHYDVNAPIGHKITTTAGVVEFFPEH